MPFPESCEQCGQPFGTEGADLHLDDYNKPLDIPDAVRSLTQAARAVAKAERERDEARAVVARVRALADRKGYVSVYAILDALDGRDSGYSPGGGMPWGFREVPANPNEGE